MNQPPLSPDGPTEYRNHWSFNEFPVKSSVNVWYQPGIWPIGIGTPDGVNPSRNGGMVRAGVGEADADGDAGADTGTEGDDSTAAAGWTVRWRLTR